MSLPSPRLVFLAVVAVITVALTVPTTAALGGVNRFATLPAGPGHPEGIAADSDGNIYVATFEFPSPANRIYVFRSNGDLRATKNIAYSPLGMLVAGGALWVADFGNGDAVKYDLPLTSASTEAMRVDVCGGAGAGCALNAFAAGVGGLLVSDSFGGRIFRIALPGGGVSTFFSSGDLQVGTHAFPGFGANGLALNTAGNALFIANTGDDRIFKLPIAGTSPGTLATFAESVNGADGMAFDRQGRLWVAANQNDEVVALNANGRVIARRGEFLGIRRDGTPRGLLFPASLVVSGNFLYVTNAALVLNGTPGDEPEEDARRFTVSRLSLGGGGRGDWSEGDDDD